MNQSPTEARGRCHIVLMKVIAALLAIVAVSAHACVCAGPGSPDPVTAPPDPACARFRQSVETSLRLESGNRVLRQNSGAKRAAGRGCPRYCGRHAGRELVRLLMVWRAEPTGKRVVDTDGVIGGRFLGLLYPEGRYFRIDAPSSPVRSLRLPTSTAVLDDLFPRCRVHHWMLDNAGRTRRGGSSVASPTRRICSAIEWLETGPCTQGSGDSLADTAQQVERETGLMLWDPATGLTRWDRAIEAEASIPASDELPRGAQTRVEQTIRPERVVEGSAHRRWRATGRKPS